MSESNLRYSRHRGYGPRTPVALLIALAILMCPVVAGMLLVDQDETGRAPGGGEGTHRGWARPFAVLEWVQVSLGGAHRSEDGTMSHDLDQSQIPPHLEPSPDAADGTAGAANAVAAATGSQDADVGGMTDLASPGGEPTSGSGQSSQTAPPLGHAVVIPPVPEYVVWPRDPGVGASESQTVWLSLLVEETGEVSEVRVRPTELDERVLEAAVDAAYNFRFRPARSAGKPIRYWLDYKVSFAQED